MATALPFIMAGVSVMQGIQGYQQNQAMAKATQQQADANIQNEKNTLKLKQQQLQRSQEIAAGKATVAAAGSGATIGSFDALFSDNENQALMDKYMLEYDSKMTQENIRYNAAVQKAQYKSAATSSLIKGISGAASGLYSSGSFGTIGGSAPSGASLSDRLFNSSYFNTTTQSGINSYMNATAGL